MKKLSRLLLFVPVLLVVLLIHVSVTYSGELRRDLVPQDAYFLLHFDAEQFFSTRLWNIISELLMEEPQIKKIKEVFSLIFDFQIDRDLKELTLYMNPTLQTGEEGRNRNLLNMVVLLRGRFNREKIETIFKLSDDYEERMFGTYKILKVTDLERMNKPNPETSGQSNRGWMSFVTDEQILWALTPEKIQQALQVLQNKTPSLRTEKGQFDDLDQLVKGTCFLVFDLKSLTPEQGQFILPLCESISVAAFCRQSDVIFLCKLKSSDGPTAQRIARIWDGINAISELFIDKYLKTGEEFRPEEKEFLLQTLVKIQITHADNVVNTVHTSSIEEWETFIRLLKKLGGRGLPFLK